MSETNFQIRDKTATFRVGDRVTYETLDEEYYSRGYGCIMETKASTIVSIYYKMANGDLIEQRKLVPVETPTESKSAPLSNKQNGSTG
jgi:hypothetical protein